MTSSRPFGLGLGPPAEPQTPAGHSAARHEQAGATLLVEYSGAKPGPLLWRQLQGCRGPAYIVTGQCGGPKEEAITSPTSPQYYP